MYMGYPVEEMEDIAILIFAHNSREAKNLAFKELYYMVDCEFIETRVHRLWKNAPHLLVAANEKKYNNNEAHVIDNPPSCEGCEYWGEDTIVNEGMHICVPCAEDAEHDMMMHGGRGY